MRAMAEVLEFWLGPEAQRDAPDREVAQRWWTKDPAFDEVLRQRFGMLLEQASAGQLQDWAVTARGRLALIILLDQFSRNIYRDQPQMYENDERALELCLTGLQARTAEDLRASERQFFYMPLMHAESLDLQERCVTLFELLAREFNGFSANVDFARKHRDIIARFGRFPHRNSVLGRTSTAEEIEFLTRPGSSF